MYWRRRAVAAAIVAGIVGFVVVLARGGGDRSQAPNQPVLGGAAALAAAPCPAPKRVRAHEVSEARLAQGRRGVFKVFTEEVELDPPIDWAMDPIAAHRFRQNLHKLRYTGPLLAAYRQRGDVEALRQVVDLTLDWVRANPRGGERTPVIAWLDKVVADRLPVLAFTTRAAACEGLLDRSEIRELLAALRRHGAFLADDQNYAPDNHGLFVDMGLFLLADYLPFLPRAESWRQHALSRFISTLEGRLADGIWLEHSTSYQFLVLEAVEEFAGYADDPRLGEIVAGMREAAAWLVMPDSGFVQFGDSDRDEAPDWAAARARELEGMRAFPEAGLVVVRPMGPAGEGSYLAVTAGFHNLVHKHADELSFDLYERGHRVVADTGLFNTDPGPARDFVLSAHAHSTLLVDDEDFPIHDAKQAYGSGIVATGEGGGWYAILARNPLLRERGVRHARAFLYKPGTALVLVDRVRAQEPHTYSRLFQLGPDIDLDPPGQLALRLSAPSLLGELHDAPSGVPSERAVIRGQADPLAGWTAPRFRRFVPRWTVRIDSRGADVTLVATLAVDPSSERARVAVWEAPRTLRVVFEDDAAIEVRVEGDVLSLNAAE